MTDAGATLGGGRRPATRARPERPSEPKAGETKRDPDLVVRLFGGPSVWRNEVEVRLSPQQSALVAMVFGHARGSLSRSEAIWLLWEADPGPKERHALRQLLHATQQRVGSRIFETPGDRLAPSSVVGCDLDVLTALFEDAELKEAATIVGRGFAVNLGTAIGRELEDWVTARRTGLETQVLEAATRAWHEHSDRSWSKAASAAEAVYRLRPHDIDAIARVMEARARTGRVAGAEAVYAGYEAWIERDGAPRSPEVEELIERVRSLDSSGLVPTAHRRRELPMVGRDEELVRACRVLDEPDGDRCDVLVVRGEAGIGKTRLIEEIRREGALRGFRCLSAAPAELERQIALNPIIDALGSVDVVPHLDVLGEPWKAIIASVLPASATEGVPNEIPPIQEGALSRRLLDAFWMLFDQLASEGPLLLVIDDVQWSDPSTVAMLQFVQRRWDSGRLAIVYGVRAEALERGSDLEAFLEQCVPDPERTIALGDLSDADARELLRHAVEETLDETTADWLTGISANHPFYIVELAEDYNSGRLEPPQHAGGAINIPVSLKQLFDSRIRDLSEGAVKIASLLAVRAKPIRLPEVSALERKDLESCADCVEELERRHLVTVDRDRVGILHDLFRAALYGRLREVRRSMLHRRVAEHLERQGSPDVAGELAIHYSRAGDEEKAVRFALEAAGEARASGALASAAQYFEIVIDNSHDELERALATDGLATTLHLDRQITRATPMLELASARLRLVGEVERARRVEIRRIESLAELAALPIEALIERLRVVKEECEAGGDWEAVALGLNLEVQLLNRSGDVLGVREVFHQLERVASSPSAAARCLSNGGLGMSVIFGGRDDGLERAQEAVDLAVEHSLHQHLPWAQNRLVLILLLKGRLKDPDAEALIKAARASARTSGDRFQQAALEGNLAVFALDSGELDQAETHLDVAARLLEGIELIQLEVQYMINRAELYLGRSEFTPSRAWFERAETAFSPGMAPGLKDLINAGLGLCALEEGRVSEALRRFATLAPEPSTWTDNPHLVVWLRARVKLLQGHLDEALDELRQAQDDLYPRIKLAWLALRVREIELCARYDRVDLNRLEEALAVARDLRLDRRRQQLESLKRRIGS